MLSKLMVFAAATLVTVGCASSAPDHSALVTSDPATGTNTLPTASGSPTGPAPPALPADVPTTGPNLLHPGEKPPLQPPAALEHSQAGAVAFARFFVQTVDWGYATTNPSYLEHYIEDGCIECKNSATLLRTAQKANQYYTGGRISIQDAELGAGTSNLPAELSVVLHVNISALQAVDGQQRVLESFDAEIRDRAEVWLSWANERWNVADLQVRTP